MLCAVQTWRAGSSQFRTHSVSGRLARHLRGSQADHARQQPCYTELFLDGASCLGRVLLKDASCPDRCRSRSCGFWVRVVDGIPTKSLALCWFRLSWRTGAYVLYRCALSVWRVLPRVLERLRMGERGLRKFTQP